MVLTFGVEIVTEEFSAPVHLIPRMGPWAWVFILFFGCIGVQTQGFMLARHSTNLFFVLVELFAPASLELQSSLFLPPK
jgi:hypothetical protein